MSRSKRSPLRAAAAAAVLSLSLAAPALADHGSWRDDRHRRGYPVHRHADHCDRRGHDGHQYFGHPGRHGYRSAGHYGCRPCGKRWRSERSFHRHLHGHHGFAYRAIPRLVVSLNGGWIFLG